MNRAIIAPILLCASLFLSGCIASTYRLTPEEQSTALLKYPQSPALNLVDGEPGWNAAKIVARVVLAPLTLCISEGILKEKRERPFRLYHAELRDLAHDEAAKLHADFPLICQLAYNYSYFDDNAAARLDRNQAANRDTQPDYWEEVYHVGCMAIVALMDEYGFSETMKADVQFGDGDDAHKTRVMLNDNLERTIRDMEWIKAASQNNPRHQTAEILEIHLDAYGPGLHSDQYGRPVKLIMPGH